MKNHLSQITAALALAGLAALPVAALANGTVQNLSGTISVQKPDGSVKLLSKGAEFTKGDTIETQNGSYAQVKMADGAVMTMKPGTRVKLDDYVFNKDEPAQDKSAVSLLRGGLRMVTGLIGKRGNQDALQLGTATATIGIRGTTFNVDDCVTTSCERRSATRVGSIPGGIDVAANGDISVTFEQTPTDAAGFSRWAALERVVSGVAPDPFLVAQAASKCPPGQNEQDCLAPAVFVGVSDGEIIVTNAGGVERFRAGQFGSIANMSIAPSRLPGDPGLVVFQLPSAFVQSVTGSGASASRNASCIVN